MKNEEYTTTSAYRQPAHPGTTQLISAAESIHSKSRCRCHKFGSRNRPPYSHVSDSNNSWLMTVTADDYHELASLWDESCYERDKEEDHIQCTDRRQKRWLLLGSSPPPPHHDGTKSSAHSLLLVPSSVAHFADHWWYHELEYSHWITGKEGELLQLTWGHHSVPPITRQMLYAASTECRSSMQGNRGRHGDVTK